MSLQSKQRGGFSLANLHDLSYSLMILLILHDHQSNAPMSQSIYLSIYLSIYYIIKTALKEGTMFAVETRNYHINRRKIENSTALDHDGHRL